MTNSTFNAVKDFKGFTFVSLLTNTKQKILKKDRITKEPCPYTDIFKVSKLVGSLGNKYEDSVNNKRGKEGKTDYFESGQLPFGQWVEGSKTVIEHKDNFYIRMSINFANNPIKSMYVDVDGNQLNYNDIKNYLPTKSENKSQGLDNPVKVCTYKVDSIKYLKFSDVEYTDEYFEFTEVIKKALEIE